MVDQPAEHLRDNWTDLAPALIPVWADPETIQHIRRAFFTAAAALALHGKVQSFAQQFEYASLMTLQEQIAIELPKPEEEHNA